MIDFLLLEMLLSPWETIEVVAVCVFFANVITVVLPNKVDNKYLQFVVNALNTLSMNIIRNANRLYPERHYDQQLTEKKRSSKQPPKVGGRDA